MKGDDYLSVVPGSATRQGESSHREHNNTSTESLDKIPKSTQKDKLVTLLLGQSKLVKFIKSSNYLINKLSIASIWLSAFFFSALLVQEVT